MWFLSSLHIQQNTEGWLEYEMAADCDWDIKDYAKLQEVSEVIHDITFHHQVSSKKKIKKIIAYIYYY